MRMLCIAYWTPNYWWAEAPAIKISVRGHGQNDSEAFRNLAIEIEKRFPDGNVPLYEIRTGWIERDVEKVFYYARRMGDNKWWAVAPALEYTLRGHGDGSTMKEAVGDLERKVKKYNDMQSWISIKEIVVYEDR